MTELRDITSWKAKNKDLILKVTKSVSGSLIGKFIVGWFYERNGVLYCYEVPGNKQDGNWGNTPDQAIKIWKAASYSDDNREIINPY